jgi:hypothetical protein
MPNPIKPNPTKPTPTKSRVDLYRRVYTGFNAPVSRFDCGRKCAPHNGGTPICCSTEHAVPILDKYELELLRTRSDLWRPYKPNDAAGRAIVADMHKDCRAAECKGAAFCERDNRSLACRAFPFYPYITRDGEIVGLAYYWVFEDRCWVISHLEIVTRGFVRECLAAYESVFAADPEEFKCNKDQSADMRRLFSRRNRIIPLVGRNGEYLAVEPRTHVIRPATPDEFPRHGPYQGEPPAVDR